MCDPFGLLLRVPFELLLHVQHLLQVCLCSFLFWAGDFSKVIKNQQLLVYTPTKNK